MFVWNSQAAKKVDTFSLCKYFTDRWVHLPLQPWISWKLVVDVGCISFVWDVCLKYVLYPVASTKRNKYHEDHSHCAPNINVFTRKHVTMVPSTDPSFSVSLTVLEDVLTLRFKVILHELILTCRCSIPLAGMFECDTVIIASWETTTDEAKGQDRIFQTWILMLGRTEHFWKQSSICGVMNFRHLSVLPVSF